MGKYNEFRIQTKTDTNKENKKRPKKTRKQRYIETRKTNKDRIKQGNTNKDRGK